MPHAIIEHSFSIPNPQIKSLLLTINQNIAKNEGNFDISQCKARAVFRQNFIVADGTTQQDFMHITVRILTGRTLGIRKNLAENLLKIIAAFLKQNNLFTNQLALSVDIVEMEKEIYQKTVLSPN
jgi:5-carboxymethyl-2-hydroxymuconate isomerase